MAMRIGIFTEKFPPEPGGLARHSWRLASNLARQAGEVFVVAPTPELAAGEQTVTVRDRLTTILFGVQQRSSDTLQDWQEVAVAAKKRYGIELFHALHCSYAAYVAVLSARACGVPAVVSTRGADLDSALVDYRRMPLVWWALNSADAICTPSNEMGRRIQGLIGERTLYLVPPAVDTEVFRREPDQAGMRRDQGLENARVIGFIGEAKKKKGLVPLLKAFRGIAEADPGLRLLLVGAVKREDAGLIDTYLKANPAIAKSVLMVKWLDDAALARQINMMDVLVAPSLRTTGPGPALEGMACEVPVVVTDVPGARDFVREGETGLIIQPRDENALASALTRLLGSEEFRRQIGANARAAVLAGHSVEKEREALFHAYDRALGRGEAGKTIRFQKIPTGGHR
jgi:glycosyltransferase involved in cell wall biosynthesis